MDSFEPTKTFHGFRCAEVDGWPGDLTRESLEAVVVHTELQRIGSFECSNHLLIQLHSNVVWEPSKRQGDLGHARHPRVIETLRQPRNHPQQHRKEGDLIIGKGNRSAIGTLVERTTRFIVLVHLAGIRGAENLRNRLAETVLPVHLRRSLTWDQATEMACHQGFTQRTRIPVYVCDPASPWQRGSNENTNGLLRQYFLKGTDLGVHSPEHLATVAAELNRRPREILGGKVPWSI